MRAYAYQADVDKAQIKLIIEAMFYLQRPKRPSFAERMATPGFVVFEVAFFSLPLTLIWPCLFPYVREMLIWSAVATVALYAFGMTVDYHS